MKRHWMLAVVAFVALVALLRLLGHRASDELVSTPLRSQPGINQKPPSSALSTDSDAAPSPTTPPQAAQPATPAEPKTAPADPQFQQWISQEARTMEHPSVDSERKEREIRDVVRKLTPAQARQLLQTAIHPQSPAREKILSAYLLVEGGLNTRKELQALAAAPLEHSGAEEPHSVDEVNSARDKSLRIMAIDGMARDAAKDPRARDALARTIEDIQDPYVKAYAQNKLNELDRR